MQEEYFVHRFHDKLDEVVPGSVFLAVNLVLGADLEVLEGFRGTHNLLLVVLLLKVDEHPPQYVLLHLLGYP